MPVENKFSKTGRSSSSSMQKRVTPVAAAAAGKAQPQPSAPKRLGRGVPHIYEAYTEGCSCIREDRDKTIVFCRHCGFYCHGRIRLKCNVHPRVSFLMDIAECPRCRSSAFLDEFNF